MHNDKRPLTATEIAPRHPEQKPATRARKRGLWNRLPAVVKIILTLPVVMALLGAEIELRLAPQLDIVLTAAGILAMWAWLEDSARIST